MKDRLRQKLDEMNGEQRLVQKITSDVSSNINQVKNSKLGKTPVLDIHKPNTGRSNYQLNMQKPNAGTPPLRMGSDVSGFAQKLPWDPRTAQNNPDLVKPKTLPWDPRTAQNNPDLLKPQLLKNTKMTEEDGSIQQQQGVRSVKGHPFQMMNRVQQQGVHSDVLKRRQENDATAATVAPVIPGATALDQARQGNYGTALASGALDAATVGTGKAIIKGGEMAWGASKPIVKAALNWGATKPVTTGNQMAQGAIREDNLDETESAVPANAMGASAPSNPQSAIAQPENLLFKKPKKRKVLRQIIPSTRK